METQTQEELNAATSVMELSTFKGTNGKKKLNTLRVVPLPRDEKFFANQFQTQFSTAVYPLSEIEEAFNRSEAEFQQLAVNQKSAITLSQEIFVKDGSLIEPITLALVPIDGQYVLYGVGGRHRTFSLRNGIDEMNRVLGLNLPEQVVQVVQLVLDSKEALIRAIKYDNDSRSMKKAELTLLDAQLLGASLDDTSSFAKAIDTAKSASISQAVGMIAAAFLKLVTDQPLTAAYTDSDGVIKTLALGRETVLGLGRTYGNYLVNRIVPRPPVPKANAAVTDQSQEDINEYWNGLYPVPAKDKLEVPAHELLPYVSNAVDWTREVLNKHVFEDGLVSRHIAKADFTYKMLTDFDEIYGESLNSANAKVRAEKEAAKAARASKKPLTTQSVLDKFQGIVAAQGLAPEAIEALQAAVRQAMVG